MVRAAKDTKSLAYLSVVPLYSNRHMGWCSSGKSGKQAPGFGPCLHPSSYAAPPHPQKQLSAGCPVFSPLQGSANVSLLLKCPSLATLHQSLVPISFPRSNCLYSPTLSPTTKSCHHHLLRVPLDLVPWRLCRYVVVMYSLCHLHLCEL